MHRWPVMILALAGLLAGVPVAARAQTPASLTLTPNSFVWIPGTSVTVTGEVTLTSDAPSGSGGIDVTLSSNRTSATTFNPASVNVGRNRAAFTFTVSDGSSPITIS